MEFRIRRALHAMVRPHHLRFAGEFAHVEGVLAGMLGGEAAVIFRVPVLRGDDEIVAAIVDQGIGDGHDPVAIGNGQIAARAKTVLDIDEQQRLHDVPPFSGQDAKPALTDQAPFDLSGRHGCFGQGARPVAVLPHLQQISGQVGIYLTMRRRKFFRPMTTL